MFDDILRPASDQFYFQLQPHVLNITNPGTKKSVDSSNSTFRLKIMKGVQSCDEIKNPLQGKSANGQLNFQTCQLTFYLPSYNPERPITFQLVLLRTDEGKKQIQVGRYSVKSGDFISSFKKDRTKLFQETVSISQSFQLSFNLYINKSRQQMEKFIKESKGKQTQYRPPALNVKSSMKTPSLVNGKSQILSTSDKANSNLQSSEKFMGSPNRKIVRKQTDRKLLMRNGSPQRSQKSQQSGSINSRNLKFTHKSPPKEQKKVSLAQKQIQAQQQEKRKAELEKKKLQEKRQEEKRKRMQKVKEEKEERQRKQKQQRQRVERENRSKERQQKIQQRKQKQRLQREQRQRQQKQEQEKAKRQQQRIQKQKQIEQQKLQQERLRKQQQEKARREKQRLERQERIRLQKQRRQKEERQERQRQARQERKRKIEEQKEEKRKEQERLAEEQKNAEVSKVSSEAKRSPMNQSIKSATKSPMNQSKAQSIKSGPKSPLNEQKQQSVKQASIPPLSQSMKRSSGKKSPVNQSIDKPVHFVGSTNTQNVLQMNEKQVSPKSNSVKSKSSLKGFMKRTDSEVVGSEGSVHKLKTRPKLEVQDISISSRQDKSFGKKLAVDEPIKKKQNKSSSISMVIFLLASIVLMYLAMTPSRKF